MPPFNLDALIIALAAEFQTRDMQAHLRSLRVYYRGYRARRRQQAQARPRGQVVPWDEETVIAWLGTFRVPPFDHMLPVIDRAAPCPACGAARDMYSVLTRCSFPGGAVFACRYCNTEWLEIDSPV